MPTNPDSHPGRHTITRRDIVFKIIPALGIAALDVACGGQLTRAQGNPTATPPPAATADFTPGPSATAEVDPFVNYDVAPTESMLRGLQWQGDVTAAVGTDAIKQGPDLLSQFSQATGAQGHAMDALQVQTNDGKTHQFPFIEVTGDTQHTENNGLWWVHRDIDNTGSIKFDKLYVSVNTTANIMRLGYDFGPQNQYLAVVLAGRYDPNTRRWAQGQSLTFYPVMPENYYHTVMGTGNGQAEPSATPTSSDAVQNAQELQVTPAAIQMVNFRRENVTVPQTAPEFYHGLASTLGEFSAVQQSDIPRIVEQLRANPPSFPEGAAPITVARRSFSSNRLILQFWCTDQTTNGWSPLASIRYQDNYQGSPANVYEVIFGVKNPDGSLGIIQGVLGADRDDSTAYLSATRELTKIINAKSSFRNVIFFYGNLTAAESRGGYPLELFQRQQGLGDALDTIDSTNSFPQQYDNLRFPMYN